MPGTTLEGMYENVLEVPVDFNGTNPTVIDLKGGTILGTAAATGIVATALTAERYLDAEDEYVDVNSDADTARSLVVKAGVSVTLDNVTPWMGMGQVRLTQDTPTAETIYLLVGKVV